VEIGSLEYVFKTFETARKIEMFRVFMESSADEPTPEGKKALKIIDRIENVSGKRNIVCHGQALVEGGRRGLRLDSAAKYFHKNRRKYTVYFDELPDIVNQAEQVAEQLIRLCKLYREIDAEDKAAGNGS